MLQIIIAGYKNMREKERERERERETAQTLERGA
jgi:hypothetical protein